MSILRVTAPDISCDQCRTNIRSDLGGAEGVRSVEVDVERRTVAVDFDESIVGEKRLRELLVEAGYPPAG